MPGPPRNGPSPSRPWFAGFSDAASNDNEPALLWANAAAHTQAVSTSKNRLGNLYEEHTTMLFVKSIEAYFS